jgi:hypothetical protein
MEYINLTPHTIVLNDGRAFTPSDKIARVTATYTPIVDDVCSQQFGDITNLPDSIDGVTYIVSAMVLGAVNGRTDVVAPATGHPKAVRNDKGHILSVPCFVSA